MATIFEKFPGIDADRARIYPVQATFTASVVGGFFKFVKAQQLAFEMEGSDLIVLDGVTLASNIDQLEFSKALQGPFEMALIRGGNNRKINLAPFRFAAFNQGEAFAAVWTPSGLTANKEKVFFQLDGALKQTPALAGYGTVSIYATATIYILKQGALQKPKTDVQNFVPGAWPVHGE